MDLIEYEKHSKSEATARRYLLSHCWKGRRKFCPKCGHNKLYKLSEKRMRCASCRYTFHDFSKRWINVGGLTCLDWLRLVKLFEMDLTANKMVPQLRLSYNTVYKAVTTLRFAIMAQALDAAQLLGGEFGSNIGFEKGKIRMERDKSKVSRIPVFGICERKGWVFIDLVPNIDAEDVFHFNLNFSLRLKRMGNIVYTDSYKQYDALIFCANDSLPFGYMRSLKGVPMVDAKRGAFWNFIRERLKRHNGVTPRRFPLYLKEIEFRHNRKNEDIFPLLMSYLCDFIPNYE